MGKSKKIGKLGGKVSRPTPLSEQLEKDAYALPTGRVKNRKDRLDEDEEFVNEKLSAGILKQSLSQLRELEVEDAPEEPRGKSSSAAARTSGPRGSSRVSLAPAHHSDDDNEEVEVDETEAAIPQNVDKVVNDFEAEMSIDPEDEAVLKHFMTKSSEATLNLADIVMKKIQEKKQNVESQIDDNNSVRSVAMFSDEQQEACRDIGQILSRYRSGKIPKIFKSFPRFNCWEELLYLTDPDKWTAAAMYQATRIFSSNLKDTMAQRYYNLVLLPRVRDDISFYKKLNYHLYQALHKALFKPAAFFKGILFPLLLSGNCTLREAIIIGSVISRASIPIMASAAAVLKIAEMGYSGANSIFLRIFFDKKYALPYRVIDACVSHFVKFERDYRELPVLWHQAFLTFVQRYKHDISGEQKDALLDVLKTHGHYTITAEIRREIGHSRNRGDPDPDTEMLLD